MHKQALAQREEKEDSSQDDAASVKREKKRKLKGHDMGIKRKRGSAGRDTDDELDI